MRIETASFIPRWNKLQYTLTVISASTVASVIYPLLPNPGSIIKVPVPKLPHWQGPHLKSSIRICNSEFVILHFLLTSDFVTIQISFYLPWMSRLLPATGRREKVCLKLQLEDLAYYRTLLAKPSSKTISVCWFPTRTSNDARRIKPAKRRVLEKGGDPPTTQARSAAARSSRPRGASRAQGAGATKIR